MIKTIWPPAPAVATLALALIPAPLAAQDTTSTAEEPARAEGFADYNAKLLLTNAVSAIDGASGGGISNWATIAGRQETRGIGVQAHVTAVLLPDYFYQSHGIALGIADRVELSYARQNFDTQDVGAALGIGQGYVLNQDVFGAKVRLLGDLVYGDPLVPQVSLGVQYKRNLDGAVAAAVGAADDDGIDVTLSATKLFLSHSLLVNAAARLTKANQNGLLGFGSVADDDYSLQFEGAVAYQFSRRFVIGGEFRSKPDNLGLGEDDWFDLFAAYAPTDNITLTAAYADLGSIATFTGQRGAFLQAQVAF
ncbi:DUF3034 family protein [Erythrobacter sp.]|uniref:DUF3034 family protein n=1 Tax=Erythrobacter sp. TaxID=1042 RepID=UPI001B0BA9AE|nr:DUF3034 family protein [Erythrobacter sp.]MBO6527587.1 DUF3034 family protein [Erythrobacter sp.]MBO6530267.1 DUF3034 family protein [Erythrobacter sp.]